jgi:hypothetical protein
VETQDIGVEADAALDVRANQLWNQSGEFHMHLAAESMYGFGEPIQS